MLSQKAKYALKALIALAEAENGELLQAGEMAEAHNIPKKFLDLILLELRRHRLVDSRRGKRGGYLLMRPADTIKVGDIVRVIDGPLAPIPCASVTAYRPCTDCGDTKSCTVRKIMREVRDAAAGVLDNRTLADLAKPPKKAKARRASA
ncbi:RrF2 family transcriptional regulator [Rhizomicrobium electricum]|jgi:Rrf2 family protein|uniref:Rrf2 family transcriptional regulator n=1 Tax=Rhizomicrobium electricum TaxID=480070 RepID=A0ABN1E991_9PROT|nr:Rrf2 family transcriptional regulator [Rhizomicrobium electricum]NIJ47983.1 Rrf2 family protein [Rhizomicrobium electricum]